MRQKIFTTNYPTSGSTNGSCFIVLKLGHSVKLFEYILFLHEQLLRLESIHKQGYVHRDLKPENFLMGCSGMDASTVYLIDFGLAKRYRSSSAHVHVPYMEGLALTGTARYASLNSHAGCGVR